MTISSTDIVYYASASMPEDNSTTSGGAIDTTTYVIPSSSSLWNSLSDTVEVLSSAAGDNTQTVTIYGRLATGVSTSDVISLNGTTVVAGAVTFDRINKIVVSGAHTGTITVRKATGDTTLASLPTGILASRRMFLNATADVSTGSSRDYYEKIFIKNTHGSLSLLGATVQENSDPSSNIAFNIDNAVNGTTSVASRLNTVPSSQNASFDSADKTVPGTNLAAGAAIGVWLKLTLAAGASPSTSTYTLRMTGSST